MTIHDWLAAFSISFWPAVARHLWQATLFAVLAYFAAVLLRRGKAQARHTVWLLASAKFVIPGAALSLAAAKLAAVFPSAPPGVRAFADFPPLLLRITAAQSLTVVDVTGPHREVFCLLTIAWLAGAVACLARWMRQIVECRRMHHPLRPPAAEEQAALNRVAARLGLHRKIELQIGAGSAEPGVWGVWRPKLVLPDGISEHLTAAELEAVLMHEATHVGRCDNLVSAAQRLLSAIFWFHPVVWWLDRKLLAERECACDEAVVERLAQPEDYATAILKVCRFYASNPAAGIASVTGSNLKKRTEQIMSQTLLKRAPRWQWLVVSVLGVPLLLVPAAVGFLRAQAAQAPETAARPAGRGRFTVDVTKGPQSPDGAVASLHFRTLEHLSELIHRPFPAESGADSPYDRWVNQDVFAIISDGERAHFLALTSDEDRQRFIETFWKRREPTPGTAPNAFREEHYRRLALANQRFRSGDTAGWKTDRGLVYAYLGPPDEIEEHPGQFAIWRYNHLEGSADTLELRFDLSGGK
jgi:GWxTD domain-containing protein